MRSLLTISLLLTLVFGTSHWYMQTASICPAPVTYRIGNIDERFNIYEDEVKSILSNSAKMWEDSLNRELFVYDEDSTFPINFIYDERQQLVVTEEEWRISLDRKEAEGRKAIEDVKDMDKEYKKLQKQYSSSREAYESRLSAYNSRVEKVNQQGGATEDVFKELQAEQQKIEALVQQLIKSESELNKLADDINELGNRGNRMIDEYNKEVLEYNEIFGEASVFTQGDFRRDRINIYKFSDTSELTRVIAHEFGHALGIGHVEGEDSIMYYLAKEQSDSSVLSTQDMEEFLEVCGDGDEFSYKVRHTIRTALSYF